MKDILNHLFDGKKLTKQQAQNTLKMIANGECNNSQIASFITSFLMRTVTVSELEGFRDALLELCIPIDLKVYNPVDLCGTGGDGKNAFNISTIASFIVAGSGTNVAKHGNYGVSSHCGSSNVLEYLGFKFTNEKSKLEKQIESSGICFLHAPLFHPALKTVAPIRKELGVKTFFNILGPMVNPSFPQNQIIGVFSLELARLYSYIYQKTNKNFTIVHSLDGFDEISLTDKIKIFGNNIDLFATPEDLGFETLSIESLSGGNTIEDAAKILVNVLQNKGTKAQNNVVIANAGMAIHTANPHKNISESFEIATESLISGKAFQAYNNLKSVS